VSEEIKNIMKYFDSNVESPSPDEFMIDITEHIKNKGLDHDLGRIYTGDCIRKLILEKTKLTASCGVSCNRLLAKVCADYNKPNA
jgi:nucleotidyltransferase/DNA polymerase involved in DNA repair